MGAGAIARLLIWDCVSPLRVSEKVMVPAVAPVENAMEDWPLNVPVELPWTKFTVARRSLPVRNWTVGSSVTPATAGTNVMATVPEPLTGDGPASLIDRLFCCALAPAVEARANVTGGRVAREGVSPRPARLKTRPSTLSVPCAAWPDAGWKVIWKDVL